MALRFQRSWLFCRSHFPTPTVTVWTCRHRAKPLPPCEVPSPFPTPTVTVRTRRHRVKPLPPCEAATTVRSAVTVREVVVTVREVAATVRSRLRSLRHRRVLFLCSSSASITGAKSPTKSLLVCVALTVHLFSPFEGQHLNPNHALLLFCWMSEIGRFVPLQELSVIDVGVKTVKVSF